MVNNKKRLYWTLQLTGWLGYAFLQIAVFSIAQEVTQRRVFFFIAEAFLCLGTTHFFRYFLNRFGWLSLSVPKMFPRVLISISVLGFIIYFLRVPVSIALNVVSVQQLAFDTSQILGFGSFYVFLLFLFRR